MRYALFLLAAALCPLHAASDWLRFTSDNFEMYTTAGEKEARRTLEYFEQVRDFFMRVKSQNVTTRLPVTIVAFKNQKEYKPYTPRETAAAYFTGDEQRDYIVLGGVGTEQYPVAVHEYMHLLIRHSGLKMPSWLNEGMAEVYSTLKPIGDKVVMGSVPEGRGAALSQLKWIPLDRLLAMGQDASEFDEKDRTSIFYSQSWLLTHMLMLSKAYSEGFPKFAADLSVNNSAEGALQRIYGKTVPDLHRDLQAYFRSNSLTGVMFDIKMQKIGVSDPRPATELEVGLTLAKLVSLLRRRDDAGARYAELAKAYPDSWEVFEGLAHLHWQVGDREKAKENFRRAVQLNPPNWKTYFDYARFAQGEEGTIEALRSTVRLNPKLDEAWLMLGYELYRGRKFQEAYDVLSEIKHVTPDRAPQLFLMKAFSAMEIGKRPEARTAAASAKQYAKTADDISQAERVIEFIDNQERPRPRATAVQEQQEYVKPALPPLAGEDARVLTPADLTQVRGVLQAIDCLGTEARVKVLVGGKPISLLIRDPTNVMLRNSDDSSVNMSCGPQSPVQVVIGFRPKEDAKFKTTGDIATVEFLTRPVKR